MSLAFRLAARELRGGLHGFRIFLACLALGVMAIAAIGEVRAAIAAGLAREGASLLGGDAEVEFTYRFADPEERAWLDDIATVVSQTVDFRSLAVTIPGDGTDEERALTQIRAVDGAYPLVGAVTLAPDMPLAQALADKGAVMEPILADRLGLVPGDSFRLGTGTYTLNALLSRYPDNASGGFSFGPRTILMTESLADSGLLASGTIFSTQYRLTLPPGSDLAALEDATLAALPDSGLRWRDRREGAGGAATFVDRLGGFLILVGLAGLAVGGVGVSSAVRAYLAGKTGVIATLKTLGATRRLVFAVYLIQIGALTLLGIAIGLVLGAALPFVVAPLIEDRLPIPAAVALYPGPLAEAALYGLLSAAIFALWPLAAAAETRPAALFRDAFGTAHRLPRWPVLGVTALLLVLLVGSAALFSGGWRLTLWTAGGILGALTLLALAAVLARIAARKFTRLARGRPALRTALSALSAQGSETGATVLSLGLGLSVLAAIGQIDGTLRRAVTDTFPDVAPSYFFVDIQSDQMAGFLDRLNNDPGVSRVDSAPMLRGIVTGFDGPPADLVADSWVMQGDRGLSYADALPPGTRLTEGEWWPPGYSGPPLVSFSVHEAAEIGLDLGDTVTVNVLGREITATVASFREVDWSSGGMGFVMVFDAAALAGAPNSWISTVYADAASEPAILRDLGRAYPNITGIRVREAVDQLARLLSGIAEATRYGAAATLLTGLLVLIGAAAAGERARTYESAVLKTLGAPRSLILRSFAIRAALLGLIAATVALAAGFLGGWAVARYLFEADYAVIWSSALTIVALGIALTLLANLAYAWRPLAARPARVLRARE